MQTRHTTLSTRKIAFQGSAYTDQWLGTRVVFTDYDGNRHLGTITRFADVFYPVADLDDGGWARLGKTIEVVDA